MNDKQTVGVFIFPDVEILDFAGPLEVFSRTRLVSGVDSRRTEDSAPFDVFTVAKTQDPVQATGGLVVMPAFSFARHPRIDLLVVPGGFGTRALLADAETVAWVSQVAAGTQLTTSVCTGALLLATSGLLNGKRATTHWGALDLLESLAQGPPNTFTVDRKNRVVDAGNIVTSAGISAGIDMALHVVERLHGRDVADETAHYMEYRRDSGGGA